MAYSIDSRTLQPGDIFIPVRGARFDGHDFSAEARAKGAQVLDVELGNFAAAHRLRHNIPVIEVTGSYGKTTTKDLLAAVLGQKYNLIKSDANQNNEIGVPLTLLKITDTTELAIVEMAMRGPGQIDYLAGIAAPTQAVITNIGWAHIELLGTPGAASRDNIAAAKAEIIRPGMTVFLNEQDDYHAYLCRIAAQQQASVVSYTSARLTDINKAAAAAVAGHFGLTPAQIAAGLASYQSSPHRQKILVRDGITIIDDTYNANPDAVHFALQILRETPARRRIAVLGDMLELGDRAETLHRQVDVTGIDLVYTLGGLAKYIPARENFREQAPLIARLKTLLRPGDALLIKGSRALGLEDVVAALAAA